MKNQGLRHAIRRVLKPAHIFTTNDLWAGERIGVELDHFRLTNVARMVVRGLFHFETGNSLDGTTWMEVAQLFTEASIACVAGLAKDVCVGKRDWPGIFEYRRGICTDVHQGSVWFIRFFGKVCYWGLTAPTDMARR